MEEKWVKEDLDFKSKTEVKPQSFLAKLLTILPFPVSCCFHLERQELESRQMTEYLSSF